MIFIKVFIFGIISAAILGVISSITGIEFIGTIAIICLVGAGLSVIAGIFKLFFGSHL
jgi:hypothetical protein